MHSALGYNEQPLVCEMINVSEQGLGEIIEMGWLTFVLKCFMLRRQHLVFFVNAAAPSKNISPVIDKSAQQP